MTMVSNAAAAPNSPTGLKSRQKARLRHVPVTRRVAAWIAACAHDSRTSRMFAICFAAAHALLWTMIFTALKGAQDVRLSVAETFAWGQKFHLGYGKSPPLAGWVSGLWFRIFPATDWAAYALAMTVIGAGLLVAWLIAVRVVDHRRAMFSVVMLALYPVFNLKAYRYDADLLLLLVLPLVVLAYLHAQDRRSVLSGFWLGVAAAAALLTSYCAAVVLAAVALTALIVPGRLAFLRSPAPWVALLTFVILLMPHVWWLKQSSFLPLTAMRDLAHAQTFPETLNAVGLYLLTNAALLAVAVLLALIALGWKLQWWKSIRTRGFFSEAGDFFARPWVRGPNSGIDPLAARQIWTLQIIIAVVVPLTALAFGLPIKAEWGLPLFFLMPLSLIAIPALRVTEMALVRLLAIWALFSFAMLLLSPIIAVQTVRQHGPQGALFNPRSEMALQLTEAWRARFNTRWPVIAANAAAGEPMTFYSPDHPLPFVPNDIFSPTLTTLEEANRLGFIGVCEPTDRRLSECEAWMTDNAPDAEKLDFSARRYFHGKAGPAMRWKVWIKGPIRDEDN